MPRWADPVSRPQARQRGFSLLELVVVIILVAILFLAAFDRLLPIRGDAEAAHVATVIGGLRSAIGLEAAARVTRDGLSALAGLEGINPVTLLQDWPDTYIGETANVDRTEIGPGTWYFDSSSEALVYQVRFPQYMKSESERPTELRWRVTLQYEDVDGSGRYEPESDRPQGLRLEPLDAHEWPGQPRGRIETP